MTQSAMAHYCPPHRLSPLSYHSPIGNIEWRGRCCPLLELSFGEWRSCWHCCLMFLLIEMYKLEEDGNGIDDE